MCLKANNNAKAVAIKSSKKCIEVVSKKLGVNIDDLCEKYSKSKICNI